MKRRVLVTRPELGASATGAKLEKEGFAPILLPLTRIVSLEPDISQPLETYDALVVTSPNAVRHIPQAVIAVARALPLFAVGEATGEAATQVGFTDVRAAGGTAILLAELIGRDMAAGARLLHLAAVQRTRGFIEAISALDMSMDIAEVYSAEEVSYSADFVKGAVGPEAIWGAPVLSERAGQILSRLIIDTRMQQQFELTRFFCISAKVARALAPLTNATTFISHEPSEESVLELLLRHAGN